MSAQSMIDCTSSARSNSCALRAIMRSCMSSPRLGEPAHAELEFARDLRRLQIVVDEPAGLVLDLVRRNAVLAPGRRHHALALAGDIGGVEFREVVVVGELHGVDAGDRAVGEGAEHVIVRHARHVAGGIEARHRGAREFVDEHAGRTVAGAEADLGDVHLDRLAAVVDAAPLLEQAACRTLDLVQRRFDLLDGLVVQMLELEEHRALAGQQLVVELQHHLAGPVVAFDEARALVVGGEGAEGTGDIGAGRAVIVLDQRIDLVAFEVRERRAGVIGHRIAVAGIGGVLVGAEHVAGGRQAQAPGGAHAEDHGLGLDDQDFGGAGVDADRAGDAAVARDSAAASPCSGWRSGCARGGAGDTAPSSRSRRSASAAHRCRCGAPS